MNIVIAGATGFVGSALMEALNQNTAAHVRALSRSPSATAMSGACWSQKSEFVYCDFYSLLQLEAALAGADVCVYLIHSMAPNNKLVQGDFSDCDLLLADNFARAAKRNKMSHIVYLSGMQPDQFSKTSHHLHSRLEVERCLGAYGTPVLVMRAGLVIGAGGSSTELLFRVVENLFLPVFLLPPWGNAKSSPVALSDAVQAMTALIFDDIQISANSTRKIGPSAIYIYEAHCGDVFSYEDILREVCLLIGRHAKFLSVPFMPSQIISLAICTLTKLPFRLVNLLIQSLKINLIPAEHLKYSFVSPPKTLQRALAEALQERNTHVPKKWVEPARAEHYRIPKSVTSIQRLPLPKDWDTNTAAREYLLWLPSLLRPFLKVKITQDVIDFYFLWIRQSLLTMELAPLRSDQNRTLFFIRGGLLDGKRNKLRGRLEFRKIDGVLIAAVLDFEPALPWIVYRYTQALVHLLVMWCFARHLAKINVSKSNVRISID